MALYNFYAGINLRLHDCLGSCESCWKNGFADVFLKLSSFWLLIYFRRWKCTSYRVPFYQSNQNRSRSSWRVFQVRAQVLTQKLKSYTCFWISSFRFAIALTGAEVSCAMACLSMLSGIDRKYDPHNCFVKFYE